MASGQQLAEQNVQTFLAWVAGKTDAAFRQMVSRGVLSRTEIAKECGFAKSVLVQNPRIKAALRELEEGLRKRGILPQVESTSVEMEPISHDTGSRRVQLETERLRRMEQENASLRAENDELKRQLKRFVMLHEALTLSGRLPR